MGYVLDVLETYIYTSQRLHPTYFYIGYTVIILHRDSKARNFEVPRPELHVAALGATGMGGVPELPSAPSSTVLGFDLVLTRSRTGTPIDVYAILFCIYQDCGHESPHRFLNLRGSI